jgi:membrane protein YqaA with SNARE-associated domain
MLSYLSLFWVAFLAASLLPFYSEVLLAALVLEGLNPFALWAWATAGNTLGALLNYVLARYFLHFQGRRWFPVKTEQLEKAQAWFNRYGVWVLLLAWAPVGGDALTFVGGLMRVRLGLFLLLVGAGKAARYAVFIYLLLE